MGGLNCEQMHLSAAWRHAQHEKHGAAAAGPYQTDFHHFTSACCLLQWSTESVCYVKLLGRLLGSNHLPQEMMSTDSACCSKRLLGFECRAAITLPQEMNYRLSSLPTQLAFEFWAAITPPQHPLRTFAKLLAPAHRHTAAPACHSLSISCQWPVCLTRWMQPAAVLAAAPV